MDINTNIPDYILDLPLEKATAEIIRLTRNSKDTSDRFNSMYNKQGALHVKHQDIGAYRGALQSVILRCFRRLIWTQQWAIFHYGKDFEGKRKRLDQNVETAARIYARCIEAMYTLDKRSTHFLNRGLEEDNWINFQEARYFVNRAKERHKHDPENHAPVHIETKDVVAQAKRQGDNTCPCFGYECVRNKGGKPKNNSLWLHRVDSARPYEPGNIWLISTRANALIRDMSSLELQYMADMYEGDNDPRAKTYKDLAKGMTFMEEELGIKPSMRAEWHVGFAVWTHPEEGEFYRAYD